MRSRTMPILLLAAAAAACAPQAPASRPAPRADAPPVRALLGERQALALSPDQVVALDSLSRALDATDHTVSHRLHVIKRGPALHREPDRALGLVAQSHARAMQAVQQLLRPEQRQRLCQLQREREEKVALRADKHALTRRGFAASGAQRREARRTWPWCAPAASGAPSRS